MFSRLVGFNGAPTPLLEEEIQGLKRGLVSGMRAEPHPFVTTGRRVRVRSGPLEGLAGIVVRRKKGNRLVVSIELIQRSIGVDLGSTEVESVCE